jgi:hypothetical protein
MQQLKRAATEANRPLFKTADGSRIFDSEHPTTSGTARSTAGGITIPIKSSTNVTDRLRYKDACTREMYDIFRKQDEQLEANGRRILEDKVDIRQSENICSSDELRVDKAGNGNVGLAGAGSYYNPATGRRTRLTF